MSDASHDADVPDESAAGASGTDEEATATGGRPCPRCERPMYHRHCKYVCPEHGVVFDCADTFY